MGLDLYPYECGNGMIIPAKVNGVSEPIYGENPLQKKSQMDTTCIYIYIAKCQFPFEEPLCWAMLSRFVQPPFARGKCTPIAALQCRASNSKELLDSSMYFLSGAQGNKSVPVLTCIRTFSHKKNREMIQAYIHGLWKIVHHPYLAICIKHAISLRTGRTHCSILWFYTIAFCCVSRNLALGPRPTAL